MSAPWDANLFECLSDFKLCIITWLCGTCQIAHQKAVVEGHECNIMDFLLATFCTFCCAVKVRGDIRQKYGIDGSMISDIMTLCCCGLCAIVQQHRQLTFKGDKPAGCLMD